MLRALFQWLAKHKRTEKPRPLDAKRELQQAQTASWPVADRIVRDAFLAVLETWQFLDPDLNQRVQRERGAVAADLLEGWRRDRASRQKALAILSKWKVAALDELLDGIGEFAARTRAVQGFDAEIQGEARHLWTDYRSGISHWLDSLTAELEKQPWPILATRGVWNDFLTELQLRLSEDAKLPRGEIARLVGRPLRTDGQIDAAKRATGRAVTRARVRRDG